MWVGRAEKDPLEGSLKQQPARHILTSQGEAMTGEHGTVTLELHVLL